MYYILPFIEQEALYEQGRGVSLGQLWNYEPDALAIAGKTEGNVVPGFLCPSDPRDFAGGIRGASFWLTDGYCGMTSYLGMRARDIIDFKTNTIDFEKGTGLGVFGILPEGALKIKIDQITDGTSNTIMAGERPPVWSFHTGGGNWLMCDGSVHVMAYAAGTTVIPAMATIAGGEEIPAFD